MGGRASRWTQYRASATRVDLDSSLARVRRRSERRRAPPGDAPAVSARETPAVTRDRPGGNSGRAGRDGFFPRAPRVEALGGDRSADARDAGLPRGPARARVRDDFVDRGCDASRRGERLRVRLDRGGGPRRPRSRRLPGRRLLRLRAVGRETSPARGRIAPVPSAAQARTDRRGRPRRPRQAPRRGGGRRAPIARGGGRGGRRADDPRSRGPPRGGRRLGPRPGDRAHHPRRSRPHGGAARVPGGVRRARKPPAARRTSSARRRWCSSPRDRSPSPPSAPP